MRVFGVVVVRLATAASSTVALRLLLSLFSFMLVVLPHIPRDRWGGVVVDVLVCKCRVTKGRR